MSRILLTGVATLDIVSTVDTYPPEDAEVRASALRIDCGGNAANTARVLAGLGHEAHLCAVLADDLFASRVRDCLARAGVDLRHCPRRAGATPTSLVCLSAASGSRTIVHHRDLPELEAADFEAIALEEYDWLHFEGRQVPLFSRLLRRARRRLTDQTLSVEIEKQRPGIAQLFPYADVLVFSKAFALAYGYDRPAELLVAIRPMAPNAVLVCSWAEAGAWALGPGDRRLSDCVHAPAFHAGPVRDTLGAGDTFNAGLIDALASGAPLDAALAHANRLAGIKVSRLGLD